MRNLTLLGSKHLSFEGLISPDAVVSTVALDLDEDCLYVATEHDTEAADVLIELWKFEEYSREGDDYGNNSVCPALRAPFVLLLTIWSQNGIAFATFRTQAYLATNPWSSPFGRPLELVSFKFLPDTRTLVLVMRGGEIATAALDDEPLKVR